MRLVPLPPLHCLIAFEAAVRLGSFTKAAIEQNVTQSSISRQISQLEAFLGRPLFFREKGSVRLTVAGQQYASDTRALLCGFCNATAEVMRGFGDLELTVATSSGVALLWLTPRMHLFRQLYPNVKLRLIVKDSVAALTPSEYDIGIYYHRQNPGPEFAAQKLLEEEVYPVGAPSYLGGRVLLPADLVNEKILMLEDMQHQWMSWRAWLARFDVELPKDANIVVVNQYASLVQMAISGEGLTLAWHHIIDSLVDKKMLQRATKESFSYGGGYYVISPIERHISPASRFFVNWVVGQATIPCNASQLFDATGS